MDHPVWPSQIALYSHLFEKMLDLVVLLDPDDFRILDTNPAAEILLGMSREDLKGRDLAQFILPEDQETLFQSLRISRRRYYPRQFQCKWKISKESHRIMEMNLCTLKISDGKSILQVIAKDITRIIEAENKSAKYLEELREVNAKLVALSITDEMTGLFNYRKFRETLTQEHKRATRYKLEYTLIFCDLDYFKHYNDHHGHLAGDKLLKSIADLLLSACRKTDVVFRYGGEEFVVVCPETSGEASMNLAQRILQSVSAADLPFAKQQPLGKITLSIGIASFPGDGQDQEKILKMADDRCYEAKQGGRNRIVSGNTPNINKKVA